MNCWANRYDVIRRVPWMWVIVWGLLGESLAAADDQFPAPSGESSLHWAFVPPQRQRLPSFPPAGATANPIDAFVLARLEQAGLKPAPPASAVTLLRRLSLDLIGLPPTVEEVDHFVADQSDHAYEKQVDRLLNSPRYGERWGRHWLDAARYADSNGYEKDLPRLVWAYRDWVIHAFNRDLSYDQFIIEQIAGDMLPGATQDQRVATGFLRNSMINEEGGIDPEEFRFEAMVDRMDTIGKSILGLTIQCAQCHDHKYDPLSQQEYYGLFAFLNNAHEATMAVHTTQEQAKGREIIRQIGALEAELQRRNPDWQQRLAQWEENIGDDSTDWSVVIPQRDQLSTGPQKYHVQPDGSLLACGYSPTGLDAAFRIETHQENIRAFRLELLNDGDLPMGGPGRSYRGTAALSEFKIEVAPADDPDNKKEVKIIKATADIVLPPTQLHPIFGGSGSDEARLTGPPEFAIDGKNSTAWGMDVGPIRRNQPRKIVFVTEQPISHPGGMFLTITLGQHHGHKNPQNQNLGRFRLSVTSDPNARADPLPLPVREILAIATAQRTPAQIKTVFDYWRTTVEPWQQINDQIDQLWKDYPEGTTTQLVLDQRRERRMTYFLERGDFLKPLHPVNSLVPAFLHSMPSEAPLTRLSFARWLVDRKSPTTARALINRVWQAYFGYGLVRTGEDLGLQSEAPSHPELLDWLAVELMNKNWSLKTLHRLIVTSATYRQSSHVSPELYAQDPYNRLLARGARFRVAAETVRDVALAVSGLLSSKLYGPSVYPPAPGYLFAPPISHTRLPWHEAVGEDRYRRAIYTFRYRSVPYPMLQAFDAPTGEFSCIRRDRSNTPLQALTTLNERLFMECAQALALQTLQHGGPTAAARVVHAFRLCLARKPTTEEATLLTNMLIEQTRLFSQAGARPWDLAVTDPSILPELPDGTTAAQLAAWTAVSRVLLNLNETITRQ